MPSNLASAGCWAGPKRGRLMGMEERMRIERNDIAWIRETCELRYLFVSSIAHDPVYFLTEIFSEDESGWKPLICAPIEDPRLQDFESTFFADATEAMEVPLPQALPAPLGRVEGEPWAQYSSQRTASWGPGSPWWQRLQYRVTRRSRYLEEARAVAEPKPFV